MSNDDDDACPTDETPTSFKALKEPLINAILDLFKKSHEFKELQLDNKIEDNIILLIDLWLPFMENIVQAVRDCLVTKKSTLTRKQKVLTKQLEDHLVIFVNTHYVSFESEASNDLCRLRGHWKGVLRLHATNFLRIVKQEMCHDMTTGGKRVKEIVKFAFGNQIVDVRRDLNMRLSGKEGLYYIAGWLLRASIKAAKKREKNVAEQLNVLVSKSSSMKDAALMNNNLPTAKVEMVERFGGLRYVNEDFFSFVERLEYVFRNTLTPELLVMNGSCLIQIVYENLNTEDSVLEVIEKFCEENIDPDVIAKVTKYITRTYCRMRGKDFARKLMSKDTNSLKQSRRPTLAAVSNPATHEAKRQKKKGDDKKAEEEEKKEESEDSAQEEDDGILEIEYLLFDAAAGNSSTEEKGNIDDNNLLES
jgi:ribosomal protein L12E/L44/L45/RPP1/RPP2